MTRGECSQKKARKPHRESRKITADFETLAGEVEETYVWLWGASPIQACFQLTTPTPPSGEPSEFVESTREFAYGNTIDGFMEWVSTENTVCYFHNLKFDGHFIMDWLFSNGYTHAPKTPLGGEFSTLITGGFGSAVYAITVMFDNGVRVEFRDSLKKLPMPVSAIANSFELGEVKGDIDYVEFRPRNHMPTWEEVDYIRRDVQIVAQALQITFMRGLVKLTNASDALSDFRGEVRGFNRLFPVFDVEIDAQLRLAYRGGWTYVDKRHKGNIVGEGSVYDVNSLYPSVMYFEELPYGHPVRTDTMEDIPDHPLKIYHVTITAKLKRDHLPTIQVKGSTYFLATEYVEEITEPTEFTLTSVDWELWNEHYDIELYEVHDVWHFRSRVGMFREYIRRWTLEKIQNTGGKRVIAKLMLNSLYGKFATNPIHESRVPVFENNVVRYRKGETEIGAPVYVPMGAFITAYARAYTIRSAQKNYDRFIYADTDSLHLLGTEPPSGIRVHASALGKWKHEYNFVRARYHRAKSYVDQFEDGTCEVHIAGLPRSAADQVTPDTLLTGASFTGKLAPSPKPGGIVLRDTTFTIK